MALFENFLGNSRVNILTGRKRPPPPGRGRPRAEKKAAIGQKNGSFRAKAGPFRPKTAPPAPKGPIPPIKGVFGSIMASAGPKRPAGASPSTASPSWRPLRRPRELELFSLKPWPAALLKASFRLPILAGLALAVPVLAVPVLAVPALAG
jgi:hypothetical protein